MNTLIVKTHGTTGTLNEMVVVTNDGKPDVIKAGKNVNYEFVDKTINRAPNHVMTKRVEGDLHISFETAGQEPDLIIEGFYDNPDQALIGMTENGSYYYYVPDTGEVYDYVTQLEMGAVEAQALGGEPQSTPWWVMVADDGFGILPWLAGIGLVGAIIGGGGGGGGKDKDPPVPVKNKPIAKDDSAVGEVGETVVVDVIQNDSDKDGNIDAKTVKLIDSSNNTEVTELVVDGEGTWSVNPITGQVTFTPEAGFIGDPTPVDYVVSDTTGLKSEPATISIDYQSKPEAADDFASSAVGVPVTVDVLANDNDLDDDIDPTTVKLVTVTGEQVTELVVDGEGTWSVHPATGQVTFTPEAGFVGDPTPVDYVVSDFRGKTSDIATITIDYQLDPNIVDIGELVVFESDGAISGSFNVSGEAGIQSVFIGEHDITDATNNPVTITTPEGTMVVTGYDPVTGEVVYTYDPNVLDHTGVDSVADTHIVTVTDNNGTVKTEMLIIDILDTVPVAVNDVNTILEDVATATGNVTPNDIHSADSESISLVSGNGSYGSLTMDAQGNYVYSLNNSHPAVQGLNTGQSLTDVFSYTVTDSDSDTSTATLTITINGASEGPPIILIPNDGLGVDGTDSSVAENDMLMAQQFTIDVPDGLGSILIDATEISKADLDNASASAPISVTTTLGVMIITGYNAVTGEVSYNYDPAGTSQNHSGGDNSVIDQVLLTVEDIHGDQATATLDILITDTVPVAVADTRTIDEDDTGITGNVITGVNATADTLGADTPIKVIGVAAGSSEPSEDSNTVGSALIGMYGSLSIDSMGNYAYVTNAAAQSLSDVDVVTDTFSYLIQDSDGDKSWTTVTLTINGSNDVPVINPIGAVRVSEEGLAGGIVDGVGNSDMTNFVTTSGQITFSDPDTSLSDLSIQLLAPTSNISALGQPVSWSWDAANSVLKGAVGNVPVIEVDVGAITQTSPGNFSATYSVVLKHSIEHPDGMGENDLAVNFGVKVYDSNTTSSNLTSNLQVIVEDDSPSVESSTLDIPVEPVRNNISIILDTSGSMGSDSDPNDSNSKSRLEVAKEAIIKLIEGYSDLGETKVQIVDFDEGASVTGWMTVADAKALVLNPNALQAGGLTNYDAALDKAILGFGGPNKLNDADNYSYFLTDGEPNRGQGNANTLGGSLNSSGSDQGIQTNEEALWTTHLTQNTIKSYAFNMGIGLDINNLKPIAYDGTVANGNNFDNVLAQNVTDLSQLDSILLGTLPPPVTKNLLTGDMQTVLQAGFGADDGDIYSISVDGVTYQYNVANNTVSVTAGAPAASVYSFNASTQELTINTAKNGKLVIDLDNGEYTYRPSNAAVRYQESIGFTVVDKDGDTASATQVLDVYQLTANNDRIITNDASATFEIDKAVLLANDVVGEHTPIDNVSNNVGGTASLSANGTVVSFIKSGNAGHSFDYTLDEFSISDKAAVSIKFETGANLLGTSANETLIGRAGAVDNINGGAGNDIIQGKSGSDVLTGGLGNDTFIWVEGDVGATGANRDVDTITDFGVGSSTLSLSHLLQGETIGNLTSMKEYVSWDNSTKTLEGVQNSVSTKLKTHHRI